MTVSKKHSLLPLFLSGLLLGSLLFVLVYGLNVLDVTNDSWIFSQPDPDIEQHYIGWCHFRHAPWRFPLGLVDSLSWPFSISILWTDSMPPVALFFKLFRSLLPKTFQYIGWYGLSSFALMGGFSCLLLEKVTGSGRIALAGSVAYILSFPIQQRMFYHTTLTAHWLIILALYLWISDFLKQDLRKVCLIWGLISLYAAMLHPYLWIMAAMILCFSLLEELIITKKWLKPVLTGLSCIASAVIGLWAIGAFYGDVKVKESSGVFEGNMNTFFNPMGEGALLINLPIQDGFQYEGYGYLGAGIILMAGFGLGLMLYELAKRRKPLPDLIKNHLRAFLIFIAGLLFFNMAIFPKYSFNDKIIFRFPMNDLLELVLGIFRSNGRFIWPAAYIVMTFAFWAISRFLCPKKGFIVREGILMGLTAFFMMIQLLDLSNLIRDKHDTFTENYEEEVCDLDNENLLSVLPRYKHLVMAYDDHLDNMKFAYFASRYGLTINRFYFARGINDAIEAELERHRSLAANGKAPTDCLYLMKEEAYNGGWKDFPLYFYDLKGTIVGSKEPLPGIIPISYPY